VSEAKFDKPIIGSDGVVQTGWKSAAPPANDAGTPDEISDGFGSVWPRKCWCGKGVNQIMRPGKIQCTHEHLHDEIRRADSQPTSADAPSLARQLVDKICDYPRETQGHEYAVSVILPMLESYALSREQCAWAQAIEQAAQVCEGWKAPGRQGTKWAKRSKVRYLKLVKAIRSLQPNPNWLREHDKEVLAPLEAELENLRQTNQDLMDNAVSSGDLAEVAAKARLDFEGMAHKCLAVHKPEPGGCTCGFCNYSIEHVLISFARELEREAGAESQ
jgi:hypothetical protein